ncbi:hypothetical protein [Xenorhabdus sp. KJ12.1]|uniref:hypothetical protein n=1 Tax=Xenorhabdus sp. KJ12.1 TaxID=1851571 RepID=UPI0030D8D8D2
MEQTVPAAICTAIGNVANQESGARYRPASPPTAKSNGIELSNAIFPKIIKLKLRMDEPL